MHPLTVMLLEQILIIFLAALSQSDIANLGDSNGIIPTFFMYTALYNSFLQVRDNESLEICDFQSFQNGP